MALARHYVSEFVSLGGEVSFDTDIRSFILTGQISCYAPWEDVHIDTVVDQRGNSASGILPKKRQLFALKIEEPAQLIEHPGKAPAIILPAGGVYIKPVLDRNLLIVGCADDLGQPFMISDPEPDPRYFHNAIEPVLDHYFPQLAGYKLSLKWAGYYDYHWPDMTPVIESVANITWIGGTSGSGIMKEELII
jgi:glycine/D-amino acid oxidase-like deaminating enzyme